MSRPHSPAHPIRVAVRALGCLLAVAALLSTSACTLTNDGKARPLSKEALRSFESDVSTTAPGGDSAQDQVKLYFLSDGHLTAVSSSVRNKPTADAVFQLLLAGPSATQLNQGLTTAIPAGVTLHHAVKGSDDVLAVDLGPQISLVSGNGAKSAYAQMVLTAKGLGIDRVSFAVDGVPVDAPTDEGNKSVVQAGDYLPPLNPG